MSDFDKEAEREKLREKYGDESEEREATQQMSELLLQGATMTNRHCEECGDPIFRHQGQEFCPSCGAGTEEGAGGVDEGAGGVDEGAGAEQTRTSTQPDDRRSASPAETNAGSPDRVNAAPPTGASTTEPASRADEDGIRTARGALARTLTRFARQAEATDDPRAAREHLAAAREAAEALAALRR